jgi:hypothetical protein
LKDPAFISQSGIGMLRNFGLDAAARAETLSEKFKRQNFGDATEL